MQIGEGEDIVYALSDKGVSFPRTSAWIFQSALIRGLRSKRDERTGLNEPLVYRLWYQLKRRVAMFGRDKR